MYKYFIQDRNVYCFIFLEKIFFIIQLTEDQFIIDYNFKRFFASNLADYGRLRHSFEYFFAESLVASGITSSVAWN